MQTKYPMIVTAGAIQDTLFAALRVLSVLIGGGTAILGFVSKRDLAGLITYVQSSDFTAVAGALAASVSLAYGLWRTYHRKQALITVAQAVPDSLATVVKKAPAGSNPAAFLPVALLFPALLLVGTLSACATTATDVRLNANKAFLTAQIAFMSAQQTTLALCSAPTKPVAACNTAIDLLQEGAKAEAAGFTAQQAGNAAGLQAALITLTNLPPQLVALGVLKAN